MTKHSDNLISNYMKNIVATIPNKDFVVYGDQRMSWREFDEKCDRLAAALVLRGVKKDDKVVILFHNRPEFLISNFAVQKCGAIPVPMNYRFTAPEIEFQADHSDAEVFIFEDMWLSEVKRAKPKLKKIRKFICSGPECPPDMESFEKILAETAPKDPNVPTTEDDICVICYTGGTTGFPKGVMLTYGAHLKMYEELFVNLLLRLSQTRLSPQQKAKIKESASIPGVGVVLSLVDTDAVRWIMSREGMSKFLHKRVANLFRDLDKLKKGYDKDVKVMFPSLPFFHDASYQMAMLAPIIGNNTLILTEGVKFDPAKVLELVQKEKPIMMANVPTGWKMLVEFAEADKYDTSGLAFAASGAGLCPVPLKKKIMKMFNNAIFLDLFGQTEMTPITSFRMDNDPDAIKERSVGKPLVDTKIVDEKGAEVPKGEVGEIAYKSKTIMKGYYKDEEKTRQVIKDGWFFSGDLGYLDENGEIRVVERKNECINTGGEKVFPLEVEQIIGEHPSVRYVCVIGVPDETWGNSIRAVVQLRDGKSASSEDIIASCEGKIAGYKRPRSVAFVDDFPLSPVGKILRNKVREAYGKK